jgi:hypothetical protein
MHTRRIFGEVQYFRQWWLWLVMLLPLADMIWNLYHLWPANRDSSQHDMIVLLGIILPLLVLLLFLFMRLETEIREDGIYVRFFPFHLKFRKYDWREIDKIYLREYKPIREYGGWGIRGFGKNRALNVSGNMGLQLELKSGKKLLIGTGRKDEISHILENQASGKQ